MRPDTELRLLIIGAFLVAVTLAYITAVALWRLIAWVAVQ